MDLPKTVKLGDATIPLKMPESHALRWDIMALGGSNFPRACAAALGACWHGKTRPKVTYGQCGYAAGEFGGRVIDLLVSQGHQVSAIVEAASDIYLAVSESVLPEAEVQAAEDFTGTPAEGE